MKKVRYNEKRYRENPMRKVLFTLISLLSFLFIISTCGGQSSGNEDEDLSSYFLLQEITGSEDTSGGTTYSYDALGRGYNLLGNYADTTEVCARVLDWNKLKSAGLITNRSVGFTEYKTFTGSTVAEYTESLSVSVGVEGNYKGFSGSVETNFSSEATSSSEYSYATVQSRVYKEGWEIDESNPTRLRDYFTDRFLADIDDENVDPSDLLDTYCSHVLLAIYTGGRMDYNLAFDMSKITSSSSLSVLANASYNAIVGSVSVEGEFSSEEESSNVQQNTEVSLKLYGGTNEFGKADISDENYTAWEESIEDAQQFVGFQDGGLPFIEIWELASDETRAAEIQAAFEERAETTGGSTGSSITIEVDLQSIEVTESSGDEIWPCGATNRLEIYGSATAYAYRNEDDLVEEAPLWEKGSGSAMSINSGSSQTISEGSHTFTITNVDEDYTFIRLEAHLKDKDECNGDDDLGTHYLDVKLNDGFSGTKTVEGFQDGNQKAKVHFTISS